MILSGTLVLIGCGPAPSRDMAPVPTADKIAPGMLDPWRPADHPDVVARIGLPAFERAVALFDKAGHEAADNPACNRLASVGIAEKSASDIVILSTTCKNGLKQDFLETALK